jgi:hypothetical protein
MRRILRSLGWMLIAGEYPGGSDHELYPLNVVDPSVAKDRSPDPRRHSLGELIPDIVAIRGRRLLIGEAKVSYNENDKAKLDYILGERKADLMKALHKFAEEREKTVLLPIKTLVFCPTLIFASGGSFPDPTGILSYLEIRSLDEGAFVGYLSNDAD